MKIPNNVTHLIVPLMSPNILPNLVAQFSGVLPAGPEICYN